MTVDRLVRFLAGRGHKLDLACFVEDPREERMLREGLGDICRRIDVVCLPRWRSYAATALALPGALPMQVNYFHSSAMERLVRDRVGQGDHHLVYAHLIRMAEYARHLSLPRVLGVQISQALNLQRLVQHAGDPIRRLFYRIEEGRVRPYEAAVCADFDRVFLCGQRDIDEVEKTAPLPNAVVCPHGQDIPPIERVRAEGREGAAIVLSGVMATYTNVDAAKWFAKDLFPRIEREIPKASFWIVGRNPQPAVQALARPPSVVVTGEVPDVHTWLCRAVVGVAPLRIGAGMQNKVIQAMACELPVVATSVANEGINATPEREILVRDDPDEFVAAVIELLRHPEKGVGMGRAARRFVETHWSWETHFERIEREFRSLIGEYRAPRIWTPPAS
jgi:glycosyltransferase involved in cell wall biosynthesis